MKIVSRFLLFTLLLSQSQASPEPESQEQNSFKDEFSRDELIAYAAISAAFTVVGIGVYKWWPLGGSSLEFIDLNSKHVEELFSVNHDIRTEEESPKRISQLSADQHIAYILNGESLSFYLRSGTSKSQVIHLSGANGQDLEIPKSAFWSQVLKKNR